MKFGVGQPVRRREDDRFLRGKGRYVDDFVFDAQRYAAFLRAPHAHARIRSIDVSAARAAEGVRLVWTQDDVDARGLQDIRDAGLIKNRDGSPLVEVTAPLLARGVVRYVGEPVAMVVADSADAARAALELIEIDYEELPAVVDARAALRPGAAQLYDIAPENRAYVWETGDAAAVEAAFSAAAHRVSAPVFNQRLVVHPIEPRAVNARYDPSDDRWAIYCATQGAIPMQRRIAFHLGVEPARVRVITPDVGGGFGMKLMIHAEYPVLAAAAREVAAR